MTLMTPSQLTVNTKRGPVRFETSLEWEEAIALCQEESRNGNKFAYDLCMRETKNLYMSEAQVSWVYKIAEDLLKLREPQLKLREPQPKPREIDASNILASLAEARAKGIKKPVLRLMDPVGNDIRVKYMSFGKNAGGCWVTSNNDLIGKIDDSGMFTFTGRPYTDKFVDEVFDFIDITNYNVKSALESYGKITSKCACCGRTLSDPKSVSLSIGPICAEKFGI